MRKLKLFSLLAALTCTATMWATTYSSGTVAISDLEPYDCLQEGVTLTGSDGYTLRFSNYKKNGSSAADAGVSFGSSVSASIGAGAELNLSGDSYTPANTGNGGCAWIVNDLDGDGITIYGGAIYSGVTMALQELNQYDVLTGEITLTTDNTDDKIIFALATHKINGVVSNDDSQVTFSDLSTTTLSAGAVFTDKSSNTYKPCTFSGDDGNAWMVMGIGSMGTGTGYGLLGLKIAAAAPAPTPDPTPSTPSTPTPAVNGKLPGAFSVSADKQVYFSQGNLQYNSNTQEWQFAENQYTYVGKAAGNTSVTEDGIANNSGIVDLFGWVGESSTWEGLKKYGITSSTTTNNTNGYGTSDSEELSSDWGTLMGSDWHTLSIEQWQYLFSTRTPGNSVNGTANAHYTVATILTDGSGTEGLTYNILGIILFPDDASLTSVEGVNWGPIDAMSYGETTCTTAGWTALQEAGCVFLPAAGYRRYAEGTTVTYSGTQGRYWSSSPYFSSGGYSVTFSNSVTTNDYCDRQYGQSVRLVSETAPASTPDPTPATPSVSDEAANIEATFTSLLNTTTDVTINRTFIKNGYFNTICLPFDLATLDGTPLANGELYELTESEEDGGYIDLTLSKVTSLTAGKPYLIKWNYGEDITGPMTFNDVTIKASEGTTVTNTIVDFVGTIGRTTLTPGDEDYLFLGASNKLYYSASDDNTSMKGFRAYFIVKSSEKSALPHQAPARFVIAAPKTPTAVENVQGEVQGTKVLENGQLYIIKNGVKYNAQGQMVK